jgi:mannose/fructose/N-acetylgalactosamine-specific phosphotransferase system component IIC
MGNFLTKTWMKVDGQKTKLAMVFWVVYEAIGYLQGIYPDMKIPTSVMDGVELAAKILTAVGLGHWVIKGVKGGKSEK